MDSYARKNAQWLAQEMRSDEGRYYLAQKIVAGGIREYTKGYRVEYEEPGVKVYESREEPGKALIIAKAQGKNYLRWEDYSSKN